LLDDRRIRIRIQEAENIWILQIRIRNTDFNIDHVVPKRTGCAKIADKQNGKKQAEKVAITCQKNPLVQNLKK
jgi:hypothetical protein